MDANAIIPEKPDYERLAERSPDAFWRLTFGKGLTYISPGLTRMTGYTEAQACGKPGVMDELIHPSGLRDLTAMIERLRAGASTSERLVARLRGTTKGGVWVEIFAVPVELGGRVVGVDCIARDVSEHLEVAELLSRRTREQAVLLQIQNEFLTNLDLSRTLQRVVSSAQKVLNATDCTVFLLSPDGKRLTAEAAAGAHVEKLLRLDLAADASILGWCVELGIPQRVGHARRDPRWKEIEGLPDEGRAEMCAPMRIGARIAGAVWARGEQDQFQENDLDFLVAVAQASSLAIANSQMFTEVRRLATVDSLTGAFNRTFFDVNIENELKRARGLGMSVGLLMLDVDGLKDINDEHGHPAGDQVLKTVVARARGALRETDWVARYGGDEFAVVLPGCRPDQLQAVADKLRRAVNGDEVLLPEGIEIPVSVSIGGAVYTEAVASAAQLILEADHAERQSKQAADGQVVVHPGANGHRSRG